MSLLREIREAATDGNSRVADLLRKCKVLAARLQNGALDRWVELELNGYPNDEALPSYRVVNPVQSEGDFVPTVGPVRNPIRLPIPLAVLPTPELREAFRKVESREGVAYFDAMVEDKVSDYALAWPPDLIAKLQGKMVSDHVCVGAWRPVPRSAFVLLLDGVRNRVLRFALEIEAEAPGAGEAEFRGLHRFPSLRQSDHQSEHLRRHRLHREREWDNPEPADVDRAGELPESQRVPPRRSSRSNLLTSLRWRPP